MSLIAALAALVAVLAPTSSQARRGSGQGASKCTGATALPSQRSVAGSEKTILCLLNVERTERGLRKLRGNRKLALAARRHSRDMIARGYFEHERRGGPSLVSRIKRTGYLKRARFYSLGENIAWGTGDYGTPQSLVRAWMNSSGHRENILESRFKQIGVGIAIGAPSRSWDSDDATTVTTDFGTRK